jgi:DNA-binding Xre family transcriptional regulator
VDVTLAQEGINHTQAAERAGVSKSHWSNVVNADKITETELDVIARGLKVKTKDIVKELSVEQAS